MCIALRATSLWFGPVLVVPPGRQFSYGFEQKIMNGPLATTDQFFALGPS